MSRVELLDEVQVRAINIANGKHLPEIPTLMFEFIGTGVSNTYYSLYCYPFFFPPLKLDLLLKYISEYNKNYH